MRVHTREYLSTREYCQVVQVDITVTVMNTYGERLEAALSTQIKVELAEREMEQKDLADAVGTEPATLSRYMTGKRSMPMPIFFKVAEVFGLSAQVLMQRAEARIAQEGQTEELRA